MQLDGGTSVTAAIRDAAEVEQRVYANLLTRATRRVEDARLCAKLASLAGSLYAQRTLGDRDVDDLLAHLAHD